MHQICDIDPHSPLSLKVSVGDCLLKINDRPIQDVLDYNFHSYDENLKLTLKTENGGFKIIRVQKEAGESLGLSFTDYLMDKPRACKNKCMFCFIDQLPSNMRDTLYFKDDDFRLSFLMGNYVSLTNMSEEELARLVALRVGPINISIHVTDPKIRVQMLGNPQAARGFEIMQTLANAGISMNAQIVLCPLINDGDVLQQTMEDLKTLAPALMSVSVVPVGLTKHRATLSALTPFSSALASTAVSQVEAFASRCLADLGTRLFFLADELFLKAGLPLPGEDYYEGYPQLENGVGMLRSLKESLFDALRDAPPYPQAAPFSIASGVSSAMFLQNLLTIISQKYGKMDYRIHAVPNQFFGEMITVSGLLTGQDLIAHLKDATLGARLLIPSTMLKHESSIFLDDMSVDEVSKALGVPVIPVVPDGAALLEAIFT